MATEKLLVLVTGSGPGLGKSTLAANLAQAVVDTGRSVELFRELDIEDHEAFTAVMEEFRAKGEASRSTLLVSAQEYLQQVEELSAEVVVLDALFPYLPSLLAWGDTDDEIRDFFVEMAGVFSGFSVLEIHLRGDLRAALDRAVAREGEDWLSDQVKKISTFRGAPPISSPDDAVRYLDLLAVRATSVLESAPWELAFIDADLGEADVSAQAFETLERFVR